MVKEINLLSLQLDRAVVAAELCGRCGLIVRSIFLH